MLTLIQPTKPRLQLCLFYSLRLTVKLSSLFWELGGMFLGLFDRFIGDLHRLY